MTFFSMFGWVVLFIMALCGTIGIPAWLILLAEFNDNLRKLATWISFALGCSAIYALILHAPFHIALG